MAEMKTLQVFDIMCLPDRAVLDSLACDMEFTDNSYHRWYPTPGWASGRGQITELEKQAVNSWLLLNGMQVDPDDKYFHVLLHSSY